MYISFTHFIRPVATQVHANMHPGNGKLVLHSIFLVDLYSNKLKRKCASRNRNPMLDVSFHIFSTGKSTSRHNPSSSAKLSTNRFVFSVGLHPCMQETENLHYFAHFKQTCNIATQLHANVPSGIGNPMLPVLFIFFQQVYYNQQPKNLYYFTHFNRPMATQLHANMYPGNGKLALHSIFQQI